MKTEVKFIVQALIIFLALTAYDILVPRIHDIEHIQNVDEMQPTPEEIYIFTDDAKYLFDGEKLEYISEIPND